MCVWVFGGVLLGLFLGAGNASGPWSSCFVVWGVGWVSVFCGWHAVGFWGSAPWCLVSPDLGPTIYYLLLLFTVVVVVVVVGLGLGGVGGLVVNCIVGVSIFVLCVLLWFVFLSVWWMPWHQGPMKDVVVCDKPRGAG